MQNFIIHSLKEVHNKRNKALSEENLTAPFAYIARCAENNPEKPGFYDIYEGAKEQQFIYAEKLKTPINLYHIR